MTTTKSTRSSSVIGTVYLLHFERPYRHARHYCGWTTNLPDRLAEHGAGRGARLLAVISEAGIGWQLARTWTEATRARERQIKTPRRTVPILSRLRHHPPHQPLRETDQ
jgi:predicted GIY-YIG superfamily endonuclease